MWGCDRRHVRRGSRNVEAAGSDEVAIRVIALARHECKVELPVNGEACPADMLRVCALMVRKYIDKAPIAGKNGVKSSIAEGRKSRWGWRGCRPRVGALWEQRKSE